MRIDDVIVVAFEKDPKKFVLSTDHVVKLDDVHDEISADIEETLTLDITLYKESSGKFQEKIAQLNVYQRRRGPVGLKPGKEGLKSLGIASLPLHELTEKNGFALVLPLAWCSNSDRATVTVTVTTMASDEVNTNRYRDR